MIAIGSGGLGRVGSPLAGKDRRRRAFDVCDALRAYAERIPHEGAEPAGDLARRCRTDGVLEGDCHLQCRREATVGWGR